MTTQELGRPATTYALDRGEFRARVALLACLLACGAFPLAMLTVRTAVSDELTYPFLLWNLFLAGLPVPLALLAETAARHRRWITFTGFFIAWLLLFPNSPYLVTDLIHLRSRPPIPLWFDALILVSAAVAGLLAGFVSLHLVQAAITRRLDMFWGWLIAVMVLGLSAFGVYLGRFVRLNSWNVLSRPRTILYTAGSAVAVTDTPRAVIVTALFSAFLMVSYATIELLTMVAPSAGSRVALDETAGDQGAAPSHRR